jgi:Cft2 family RNA processing exonuclease
MGKLKNCKIYCTTPIAKLGFYILLDSISAKIEIDENFNIFTEEDFQSPFSNIIEVKYKENKEIKLNDSEITIFPIPSGNSLGGSSWKIYYKLQSIIYAPEFNLENKYICDPFPYEDIKNPNYFITDSEYSNKFSLKKIVVENKFKKNLLNLIENDKHIFIPSDVANINLEIIISIEKILDNYFSSKNKDDVKKESNYKIILFGYSSRQIIESFKSIIEFMGATFAKEFYYYNEKSNYLK